MKKDKELDVLISQALREVEKDLSLPSNSLVDDTPAQRSSGEVKRKKRVVLLDRNFMARVPENVIQHSRELKLRKKIAEQQETISLLGKALDLLLDKKEESFKQKTAPLGATKCHNSKDQFYTIHLTRHALTPSSARIHLVCK